MTQERNPRNVEARVRRMVIAGVFAATLWGGSWPGALTHAQPSLFAAPRRLPTGLGPRALAVGDVNDDGIVDLVTANSGSSDVSVLRGHGDGSFAESQSFPVRIEDSFALHPSAVVIDRLAPEGLPALVLGCEFSCASVAVLRNMGDGVFGAPEFFVAGRGPVSVAVADLNEDGAADIVSAVKFNDYVSVLLGLGDGTFAMRTVFEVVGVPRDVAIADLNGDGVLDIAAAAGEVAVLLGAGDGTFAVEQRFGAGGTASALAIGDVNGDAVPDVMTTNPGADAVAVLRGRGDGTFDAPQTFAVGMEPSDLAMADLNRDGFPDVVTANFASDALSLLLGLGDGTFAQEERLPAGDGPRAVATADLNGDGRLDVVAANFDSADVSVLLAQGSPSPGADGGCRFRPGSSRSRFSLSLTFLLPVLLLASRRRRFRTNRIGPCRRWLVPHFEKMLYDNALLIVAYLEAYQVTARDDFARVVVEIRRYVERDMTSPHGAFYSATDADSLAPSGRREQGWFFTWTPAEIDAALDPEQARVVKALYAVTAGGNFEGRNILHAPRPFEDVAGELKLSPEKMRAVLEAAKERLYEVRSKRPAPLRDEKILAAWNGLMISAYAQSALTLDEPRYTKVAERAADFVLTRLPTNGRLRRSYKDGEARHNAYLDDYAFLIAGLLDLHEASGDARWLRAFPADSPYKLELLTEHPSSDSPPRRGALAPAGAVSYGAMARHIPEARA